MMEKQQEEHQVKTISAKADWWRRVQEAALQEGITSRSNFIRIAVDDYIARRRYLSMQQQKQ